MVKILIPQVHSISFHSVRSNARRSEPALRGGGRCVAVEPWEGSAEREPIGRCASEYQPAGGTYTSRSISLVKTGS